MKIHLIWAQDLNGGIGKNGKLPWYISEDLQNFKKLTLGSTIIMGRKTWESLPIKPLPLRRNIVLSSNNINDIESYSSIKQCIKRLKDEHILNLFIIGGASIYKNFISIADELHITQINKITVGIDTYFPVSMNKIHQTYKKKKEKKLTNKAIYSNWIKR